MVDSLEKWPAIIFAKTCMIVVWFEFLKIKVVLIQFMCFCVCLFDCVDVIQDV